MFCQSFKIALQFGFKMLTDEASYPMEEEKGGFLFFILEIFNKLDKKDGNPDGQIDCKFLRKSLNEESELHKKLGLNRSQIEKLILEADNNKDGFINKEEFMTLAKNRLKSKQLKSAFQQYFESLAYAEEFKCCPPKLFIIIITILQIFFFGMNRYNYPNFLGKNVAQFIIFHLDMVIFWI